MIPQIGVCRGLHLSGRRVKLTINMLGAPPKLVELVQDAVLADIASGKLVPGGKVDADRIGREMGVARPGVDQALTLLRKLGVLDDGPGRTFVVAPLDLEQVRNIYDVRAVMEGLAFRKAAERNAERAAQEGPELIAAGRAAARKGRVADMIEADMAFHELIYALSENPLVGAAIESYAVSTQRVMGQTLMMDESPADVWDQHEAMLDAVIQGDGSRAEKLAREHVAHSAELMIARLSGESNPGGPGSSGFPPSRE